MCWSTLSLKYMTYKTAAGLLLSSPESDGTSVSEVTLGLVQLLAHKMPISSSTAP